MKSLWDAEPTLILAAVQAGIALGIGFGMHVSAEQMALMLTFTGTVLALINRKRVVSPATLQNMTPATLATAQDAAAPVKAIVKKLPVVLLAAVLSVPSIGCASHTPPDVSQLNAQGLSDLRTDDVVRMVNDVTDAAISANRAGLLPDNLEKATLTVNKAVLDTITEHPSDPQGYVGAAFKNAVEALPADIRDRITGYTQKVADILARFR